MSNTCCDNTKEYYEGTELKVAFAVKSDGFDMGTDPWTAVLRNGEKTITFSRTENTVVDEYGHWFLLIDTQSLSSGTCQLIVDIDIPDSDFPDGYRHEVHVRDLMTIKRVRR